METQSCTLFQLKQSSCLQAPSSHGPGPPFYHNRPGPTRGGIEEMSADVLYVLLGMRSGYREGIRPR